MTRTRTETRLERSARLLVSAADRMRDGWAEAALPGQNLSDYQQELWRSLHERADAVRDLLEHPAAGVEPAEKVTHLPR